MPAIWKEEYNKNRKRKHRIEFNLTDEEYNMLNEKAYISKKSVSEYLRSIINDSTVVVQDLDSMGKWSKEIGSIGRNLNQIAKKVNVQGKADKFDIEKCKTYMTEIWDLMNKIGKSILR